MLTGKEYLQQIDEEELNYVVIWKPTVVLMKFGIADVPEYIKEMLVEFSDIVVDDFP